MNAYEQLLYEVRDATAFLTLNRPDNRNALGETLIRELKAALSEAEGEEAVKAIVVRGAGKDFCAGADLAQLQKVANNSVLDNLDDAASFAALILQIRQTRKPVIAAVHGRALAGGAGLASACDMVIATRSATFAYTEAKLGFVPAIVTAIARRNLSEKRAFEILCTAKPMSADEAERIGLINRVVEETAFETEVAELAAGVASLSSSAVALTKSLLYAMDGMTFEQALRAGVEMNALARMTPDCRAGVQKFLSKT